MRKEAKSQGISRYFTGNPCPKGHIAERRTSNGECVECAADGSKKRFQRYRQECPEKIAAHKRLDYQKHKVDYRRRADKWAKNNPETVKAMAKLWRDANHERFAAMVRDWRHRNPAAVRLQKYRRRMLETTASGEFIEVDLFQLLNVQNALCAGCDIEISVTFTVDHKVPLSRGGNNSPDNLQLLCKSCNSSKGTKTDDEWRDCHT